MSVSYIDSTLSVVYYYYRRYFLEMYEIFIDIPFAKLEQILARLRGKRKEPNFLVELRRFSCFIVHIHQFHSISAEIVQSKILAEFVCNMMYDMQRIILLFVVRHFPSVASFRKEMG